MAHPDADDITSGPGLHGQLADWINQAEKHWLPAFRSIRKARQLVAKTEILTNDEDVPSSGEEQKMLVNHYHTTVQTLMPTIYAKDPEISVNPEEGVSSEELDALKHFSRALEVVLNKEFHKAELKRVAKACVRGALTSKLAWSKTIFQREYEEDPLVLQRIDDAQDNMLKLESMLKDLDDPVMAADIEAKREELENLVESLHKQVEVPIRSGLIIDRVMPEHLILDPTVPSLDSWTTSRRVVQIIPMPLGKAKQLFQDVDLSGAEIYTWEEAYSEDDKSADYAFGRGNRKDVDPIIKIYEVWDKTTMTVYTLVKGVKTFVREPYQPINTPEQWYPFHPLAFNQIDGRVMPLSVIDLLQGLQEEYSEARHQQKRHRELSLPGWLADKRTDRDSIERYRDAVIGEIVLVDAQGRPLNEVFQPRVPPPWNPMVYDVSPIQRDIDLVTGVPDAQRAAVTRAKTLGEAEIMQQGLASRSDEKRDILEDWISSMAQSAAQILLMELTPDEVLERVGPELAQSWPTIGREQIYSKINVEIRAGSTGKPDKNKMIQQWTQLMPVIAQLQDQILQLASSGADPTPKVELLRETLRRMDERIEIEKFLPNIDQLMQQAQAQAQAQAQPPGQEGGYSGDVQSLINQVSGAAPDAVPQNGMQ